MSKVLIVGLDGASWELLNPLIENGKLPTIKHLIAKGVYGTLNSTVPPLTGPAWVSFATGKDPSSHGCYGFFLPEKSLADLKSITTSDIRGQTFYELLHSQGKKCILVNLPCSYPPRIDGTLITDFLTKGNNFVFPPHLLDEIPELQDYRVMPEPDLRGKKFIDDVSDLERKKFESARQLFKKEWDLFFLLFDVPDSLLHRIDERIDAPEKLSCLRVLTEIDSYIKWLVENCPPDVDVFLMSDHGFQTYDRVFPINKWLVDRGYLKLKLGTRDDKKEEASLLQKRQVDGWVPILVSYVLRRQIVQTVFRSTFMLKIGEAFYRIINRIVPLKQAVNPVPDTENALAYGLTVCANYGNIYINSKERFGGVVEDRDKFRDQIMSELAGLRDNSGDRIFSSVMRGEDIYTKDFENTAPDIVLLSDKYALTGLLNKKSHNDHAQQGIFVSCGNNIKNTNKAIVLEITDLAPTVLHIMNTSVPDDLDGRVLTEIFSEGSEPAKRTVRSLVIAEGKESIKTRMQKLKKSGRIRRKA